ncbi:MAG TPA: DNA adenine methylase [Roseiflexaceae bacterium]|nr:DNA adenine methylase [Roseiflexaceae bacterium]
MTTTQPDITLAIDTPQGRAWYVAGSAAEHGTPLYTLNGETLPLDQLPREEVSSSTPLKAPFPYFGGKSKVASRVWQRFGTVDNYVEPFFGSGAVLLGCPCPGHTETVNDADGLLCNFWRALQTDPEAVAAHADYPVSELDLHARHRWLVQQRADVERLLADPGYYDVQIAGWWVWGISQWIGSGWCDGSLSRKLPNMGGERSPDRGVHRKSFGQLPHVGNAGRGVHRAQQQSFGQLPKIGANGAGHDSMSCGVMRVEYRKDASALHAYFAALAARLRRVRVTCGDFARVLGPSVTWRHGTTAVFLDPPYDLQERAAVYAVESDVTQRARQWCIENGDNKLLRIALCGYDTEHTDLAAHGWQAVAWKTNGGYGSQGTGRGRANAAREVIWFSPNCLNAIEDLPLWKSVEDQS